MIIAGTEDARELLRKENLRLLVSKSGFGPETLQEIRTVPGGYLAQDRGSKINPSLLRWSPRDSHRRGVEVDAFGWRVVRHVKSNAIVYAGDECTLGVGAGQMSRVDSSRIAVWKAGRQIFLRFSIASDAFFPFADGLIAARKPGHSRDSARRKRAG